MAKRNSAHAQKRRVAAKPFSFREMMAKQKRIAALIVAVCVVAIAAIVLVRADVFPHRDGSLNVRGGKAQGTRENALMINGGSKAEPKYFEIAAVNGTMDGFTPNTLLTRATRTSRSSGMKPTTRQTRFITIISAASP